MSDILDPLEEKILRATQGQDPDVLRTFLRSHAEIEEIKAALGPQTKEELWQWMKDRVGVELSTIAVCEGHSSQLDMAWELYSFAVTRVLWVMSRGGGKTSLAAWIDECQAEHFPGWATFCIGANQTQGQRKYEYLLPLVVEGGVIGGRELEHVIRSIATETQLKNGSKMEIARGSSPENANGPRVPRLHRDETELMDPLTYKQAGMIPAGRKLRDGRYAPAQILDTSTMKYAEGLIDKQIQKYREAKEKGVRPPMEVRICCIYEVAAENPSCRSVPDEVREARLRELGLPVDRKCDCETWVSDVWPIEDLDAEGEELEPEERTLESVCQGRFFKSRGYKQFDDIQTLFQEADREQWQAEQECAQPATEGSYIKSYTHLRNGIIGYCPDPENGPIDQAVDWGSDDEHAVIWFQELERPVTVKSYVTREPRVLPIGALVAFAEIYKSGWGNYELGQAVIAREQGWVLEYPGFTVEARYPDSANLGARLDWSHKLGLETTSVIQKNFGEELKMVRTRIGKRGGFFIDIAACPWFDKAIKGWRQVNGREVRNFATHHMAAFRYREHNVNVIERRLLKNQRSGAGANAPAAAADEDRRPEERAAEHRQSEEAVRARERAAVVEVTIGTRPGVPSTEDMGIAGADDSPHRDAARSMLEGRADYGSGF